MSEKIVVAKIDAQARRVVLRGEEAGLPGLSTFQVHPRDTVKWVLCDAQGRPGAFKARVRFVTPAGGTPLFAEGAVFEARGDSIHSVAVADKALSRTAAVDHAYHFELADAAGGFVELKCFWESRPDDPQPRPTPMGGGTEGGAPPTAARPQHP